jgi:hypothetical protein
VSTLGRQVGEAIDQHCELTAEFQRQRDRVALAEIYGQVEPGLAAELEASLTVVYTLLNEGSARLAAISAALEFERGNDDGD